jgi:peptidoglycan L-alanyl-D-glutamate endopeptidase CwlK
MALNERSKKNLVGVHPDLVLLVEHAAETVPFIVTEGRRSLERQKALKAAGKSWTLDSRHLTGHAVDVVDPDGKYDIPDMDHIASVFKAKAKELNIPIVWGGDWKQRDTPHFELDKKAYPASGVSITTKAKEIATKVITSKPVLTTGGAAAGGGAAVSTGSTPVPPSVPAIPAPPDLAPALAWKGFGETLGGLFTFAWSNLLLTALLATILAVLWFAPKGKSS